MRGGYFGNATVFVPPDDDPNHGGGPIRRSSGVTVPSNDGMMPNGWPQMVLRTPHAVVPDVEAGGASWPNIDHMKFLPDGRLVPAYPTALWPPAPAAPAMMSGFRGFGSPAFNAFGADPTAAAAAAADATAAAAANAARYSQALSDWIARWGVISLGAAAVAVAGAILAPSGARLRVGTLAAVSFGGGAVFARYVQEHPVQR